MPEADAVFDYVAVDVRGRRIRGRIAAADDKRAFELLKRDGLSPIFIRRAGRDRPASGRALSDRDLAALLADLGALLGAGADMRTAFSIITTRAETPVVSATAQALSADIGGGEALESAFARRLPPRFDFVAALVAAGEAGGDLAAGFQRAADMLAARIKLAEQFASIVAYPAFVFASAIAALAVILFVVIPSLAPLVDDLNGPPPAALAVMIEASTFLRANALVLVAGALTLAAGLAIAARAGLVRAPIETLFLDGPARRTVGAIVYGGFAVALGAMLAGGAPPGEALRLATRSVGMMRARARLDPVAAAVREGQLLSAALAAVPAFPASVSRLAAVGEASGAMGVMIARAGKLEEEAALRRLELAGRILGPALIVVLGAVIGLMMGAMLSGVSQLGEAAA
jgi:type II secretory pathway component PulF